MKDSEKIAEIIWQEKCLSGNARGTPADAAVTTLYVITCHIAEHFAQNYPKFDAVKFMRACGFERLG